MMNIPTLFDPDIRRGILIASVTGTIVIAAATYYAPGDALGLLYLAPVIGIACLVQRRLLVVLAALVCAVLRVNIPFTPVRPEVALPQLLLGFLAFAGVGICVYQYLAIQHQSEEQTTQLQRAHKEAQYLIESSPAAVVTVSTNGEIILANYSARQLLGLGETDPEKPEQLTDYVPVLKEALKSPFNASFVRTMIEGSAKNRAGDPFFVQMWISSYDSGDGPRTAVIFSDASENLRDREELGLRQLLTSSHIVAGAVSHEVRNLSAAASVIYGNLEKRPDLSGDPDFSALGTLIRSLRQIASSEIPTFEERSAGVEVKGLLDELRIIIASSFRDDEIELVWEIADALPRVRADRPALLQVMLNIVQNAARIVKGQKNSLVRITGYLLENHVIVSVADSGPGLSSPDNTFQPFQQGATSTGLGLYVSRAIVRTFGGELLYDNRARGGCFVIHLPVLVSDLAATCT